ncbi:DUF1330 domain-containing protein [uncultured Ferrimonas sp.]|uniref:DUF1330 domain-containing protein n=1 Tax=uncultured Ferrimonas sp. TaxID=432640 RepID=UPI00262906FE|nr:DUF1330 domain-containing protein [uncultured Ferrimonas sp.]
MTFYSVMAITPTDDSWVPEYMRAIKGLVDKHHGQFLARTNRHQRLEGRGEDAAVRIIVAWPSKQAALDFLNDAEYAPHLAARSRGAINHHFLIEGCVNL